MNIVFSFRQETSYLSKSFGLVISSLAFVTTMILGVDVLYTHIDSIASYSRDEMLLFMMNSPLHLNSPGNSASVGLLD